MYHKVSCWLCGQLTDAQLFSFGTRGICDVRIVLLGGHHVWNRLPWVGRQHSIATTTPYILSYIRSILTKTP